MGSTTRGAFQHTREVYLQQPQPETRAGLSTVLPPFLSHTQKRHTPAYERVIVPSDTPVPGEWSAMFTCVVRQTLFVSPLLPPPCQKNAPTRSLCSLCAQPNARDAQRLVFLLFLPVVFFFGYEKRRGAGSGWVSRHLPISLSVSLLFKCCPSLCCPHSVQLCRSIKITPCR